MITLITKYKLIFGSFFSFKHYHTKHWMERNLISGKEILTIYISKTGFITTQVDILIPIDKKLPEEKIFLSSIIHFFLFSSNGASCFLFQCTYEGKRRYFFQSFLFNFILHTYHTLSFGNIQNSGMV